MRPNGFMQNILAYNGSSIRAERALYAAMGDAKVSLIDVRDVGDAVAGILSDPNPHAGITYELNGPEALSNSEVAERLSKAIGAKVTYVDIPEATQRQAMLDVGMPEWQVTAVLQLQDYYRSGSCASIDGVVPRLTGRPQRTITEYLFDHAEAFGMGARWG